MSLNSYVAAPPRDRGRPLLLNRCQQLLHPSIRIKDVRCIVDIHQSERRVLRENAGRLASQRQHGALSTRLDLRFDGHGQTDRATRHQVADEFIVEPLTRLLRRPGIAVVAGAAPQVVGLPDIGPRPSRRAREGQAIDSGDTRQTREHQLVVGQSNLAGDPPYTTHPHIQSGNVVVDGQLNRRSVRPALTCGIQWSVRSNEPHATALQGDEVDPPTGAVPCRLLGQRTVGPPRPMLICRRGQTTDEVSDLGERQLNILLAGPGPVVALDRV